MNISELKDFAELAQAAYSHLDSIAYDNKDITIEYLSS